MHSQRLSARSHERPGPSSDVKFAGSAAEAAACAFSPSSAASGVTRDAAFSVDGSSIADEGRSTQSRINISFRGASDAANDSSRPSTFGEAARVPGSQAGARDELSRPAADALASSSLASSSRHRILGEIEGLMRALINGAGRA